MSEYEELSELVLAATTAQLDHNAAVSRYADANNAQHDALWQDVAELRDNFNALSNRVETLTRAMMIDAGEVAEKMIATHTLRVVKPYDQDKDVS